MKAINFLFIIAIFTPSILYAAMLREYTGTNATVLPSSTISESKTIQIKTALLNKNQNQQKNQPVRVAQIIIQGAQNTPITITIPNKSLNLTTTSSLNNFSSSTTNLKNGKKITDITANLDTNNQNKTKNEKLNLMVNY